MNVYDLALKYESIKEKIKDILLKFFFIEIELHQSRGGGKMGGEITVGM